MNLTWRDVFDTTKGTFHRYKDRFDALKMANAAGYEYMAWNDRVYFATGEDTGILVGDLTPKMPSTGPGSPTHRFELLMNELDKRFPDPEPFSAIAYEDRLYPMLDNHLAELKTLREYRDEIKRILKIK